MQLPASLRLSVFALGCVLLAGCGKGLTLGRVTGEVRSAGKLVTQGTILFHPDSSGPTAVGIIQPDGTFTLTSIQPKDGAVVGSHRVTILATAVEGGRFEEAKSIDDEIEQAKTPGKILIPGRVVWVVPESCSRVETTKLTAKVERGDNTINFDIPKD